MCGFTNSFQYEIKQLLSKYKRCRVTLKGMLSWARHIKYYIGARSNRAFDTVGDEYQRCTMLLRRDGQVGRASLIAMEVIEYEHIARAKVCNNSEIMTSGVIEHSNPGSEFLKMSS